MNSAYEYGCERHDGTPYYQKADYDFANLVEYRSPEDSPIKNDYADLDEPQGWTFNTVIDGRKLFGSQLMLFHSAEIGLPSE